MIASYGLSDAGSQRPENEDRILVDDSLALFIVADGMGGHSYGELAAELAIATIRNYVESSRDRMDVTWPFGYDSKRSPDENRLITAIQLANRQVWQRSEQAPEYAGMGTTVAAVLVGQNVAAVASVGDSRVYLLRRGELQPLTMDDTWVGALVRQGTLNASDVPHHPMRNVLTQAAGARPNIEVQSREHQLLDQDVLLLSSDGLHGVVGEKEIQSILAEELAATDGVERSAARLIEAAREKGAPDNVSCVMLQYRDGIEGP